MVSLAIVSVRALLRLNDRRSKGIGRSIGLDICERAVRNLDDLQLRLRHVRR
jgi:hypothetical protein